MTGSLTPERYGAQSTNEGSMIIVEGKVIARSDKAGATVTFTPQTTDVGILQRIVLTDPSVAMPTCSNAKYKLAIQNLANAYRLVCPSSKSADDFDNRILRLREQHNSEEDIYAECIGVLADCVCCADWLDC